MSWNNFEVESHLKAMFGKVFKLSKREETKFQIKWTYAIPNKWNLSQLWINKKLYEQPSIDLIDDLFKNLDEGNLVIIKKIIASKYKLKE